MKKESLTDQIKKDKKLFEYDEKKKKEQNLKPGDPGYDFEKDPNLTDREKSIYRNYITGKFIRFDPDKDMI